MIPPGRWPINWLIAKEMPVRCTNVCLMTFAKTYLNILRASK